MTTTDLISPDFKTVLRRLKLSRDARSACLAAGTFQIPPRAGTLTTDACRDDGILRIVDSLVVLMGPRVRAARAPRPVQLAHPAWLAPKWCSGNCAGGMGAGRGRAAHPLCCLIQRIARNRAARATTGTRALAPPCPSLSSCIGRSPPLTVISITVLRRFYRVFDRRRAH